MIDALSQCIHILPTGSCVDLSDGEKALVLVENPADFSHPMVLKFSNNMIYDLSDPIIGKKLRIKDTMRTMDNRIAIDEDSLQHFVTDNYIKETTDRFRKSKLKIAQKRQMSAQQKGAAGKSGQQAAARSGSAQQAAGRNTVRQGSVRPGQNGQSPAAQQGSAQMAGQRPAGQ